MTRRHRLPQHAFTANTFHHTFCTQIVNSRKILLALFHLVFFRSKVWNC